MENAGNKRVRKFVLIGTLIVIALSVFSLTISIIKLPLETKTLDVTFYVSKELGADLNKSALTFGKIFPGSTATRNINIVNNYKFPIKVEFFASKEIVDFLIVKNENLSAGENYSFPATVIIPENISYGKYAGKLNIVMNKIK